MTPVATHHGSSATKTEALTPRQVLDLPALVPVWPSGAAALGGISRPSAYKLAKSGALPVTVITLQGKYYCRRSDLLTFLGLTEDGNGPGVTAPSPLAETPSSTGADQ